jgi:hypothetical protein
MRKKGKGQRFRTLSVYPQLWAPQTVIASKFAAPQAMEFNNLQAETPRSEPVVTEPRLP